VIKSGEKYLITTDRWFVAPDGEQYSSAWGTCHMKTTEDLFGFTPQAPSTNWFLVVGKEGSEMIIAGCQIHYAVRCEDEPDDRYKFQRYEQKDTNLEISASRIYLAE